MTNRFHHITGIGIEDSLTGRIYTNKHTITNLLNELNTQKNHNAEQYWRLRDLILDNDNLDTIKETMYREIIE